MLKRLSAALVHLIGLALVSALAAYWVIKVVTPQPTSAPPPMAAPPLRDADPVAAARLFGLVQAAQTVVASNIQVVGLFAAGADSAAILAVDGKPPRAYVIGQQIVAGTRLQEVTADAAVIERDGARQELRAPPRPVAALGAGVAAPPAYSLEGNVLSAPSGTAPAAVAPSTFPQPTFQPPAVPQPAFQPPAAPQQPAIQPPAIQPPAAQSPTPLQQAPPASAGPPPRPPVTQ